MNHAGWLDGVMLGAEPGLGRVLPLKVAMVLEERISYRRVQVPVLRI